MPLARTRPPVPVNEPLRNVMDLPEIGDRVWVSRPDGRLVRPYAVKVVERWGGQRADGKWRLVTYLLGGLSCSYPWYTLSRERPRERR